MQKKIILVIGATGYLGSKVINQLLEENVTIRALVRQSSDASKLEALGVEIFRGDLTKKETLVAPLTGIDAVITTAIGYSNRKKGDSLKTVDDLGNKNLADVSKTLKIPRFIFTGVLNAEMASSVPHFWQKKQTEDYFDKIGLSYISIRPGAFINQDPKHDFFAKGIKQGKLKVIGTKTKKWTQVHVEDVASYLAKSALDETIPTGKINIGTNEPMSMEMMAEYIREYTGKPLKISVLPWGVVGNIMKIIGLFKPIYADAKKMFDFFFTGKYIANTTQQEQIFGTPPTNKESVFNYCKQLKLNKKKS